MAGIKSTKKIDKNLLGNIKNTREFIIFPGTHKNEGKITVYYIDWTSLCRCQNLIGEGYSSVVKMDSSTCLQARLFDIYIRYDSFHQLSHFLATGLTRIMLTFYGTIAVWHPISAESYRLAAIHIC